MPEQTNHPVSTASSRPVTTLQPGGTATGLPLRASGLQAPAAGGPGGFSAVLAQLLSPGASPSTDARSATFPQTAAGTPGRSAESSALAPRDGSNLPPAGRKLPLARTVEQLLSPAASAQSALSSDATMPGERSPDELVAASQLIGKVAPGDPRMHRLEAGRGLVPAGQSGPEKRPVSNGLVRIETGQAGSESAGRLMTVQPGMTVVGPEEALSGRPDGSGDPEEALSGKPAVFGDSGEALTRQTLQNVKNVQGGRTPNADLAIDKQDAAVRADVTGTAREGLDVRSDAVGERPAGAAPGTVRLDGERVNGGGQGLPTAGLSDAAAGTGRNRAMPGLNSPETRPAGYRDGQSGRQEGPASRRENTLSAALPPTGNTVPGGQSAAQHAQATATTQTPTSAGWRDSRVLPGTTLDNPALQSRQPLELAVRESAQRLQRFAEQWSGRQEGALNGGQPQGAAMQSAATGNGPANSLSAFATLIGTAQGAGADSATGAGAQTAASAAASPNGAATAAAPAATASGTAMPGNPTGAAPDPSVRTPGGMTNAASAGTGGAATAGEGSAAAREQWGEALSRRISLMTARNQSEARIQLDPPELGRLMIQLQIQNEQASVQFTSPHALVRDALEGSMPKLQDLMAEEGLDLVDVDISDEGREQSPDDQGREPGGAPRTAGADRSEDETAAPLLQRAALSLVDDYA